MTFEGETKPAIEQLERAIAAARATGTDETFRLAEAVRLDVERSGSGNLWQAWLGGVALAVITVDPDRALALLDERLDLATRVNLGAAMADAEFFRGVVLFMRRLYPETETAWSASTRRASRPRDPPRHTGGVIRGPWGLASRCGTPEVTPRML